MSTLGLVMIVKNEKDVIYRALESARPFVSYMTIVDTGSTDGTQELVQHYLRHNGIKGDVVNDNWIDFSTNRNRAMDLARHKTDYMLILDADDILVPDGPMIELSAGAYHMIVDGGAHIYHTTPIVRSDIHVQYRGVLHEYLDFENCPVPMGMFPAKLIRGHDGARRKDPKTYWKDVLLLEQTIRDMERRQEPPDWALHARYTFYLAQSYRDAGWPERAVEVYTRRAKMNDGWAQERYISALYAARVGEGILSNDDRLASFLHAIEIDGSRAEAYHGAARLLREMKDWPEAMSFAKQGLAWAAHIGANVGLFSEPWIYTYGLKDEMAVAAYYCGEYAWSLQAAIDAITSGPVPEADFPRMLENVRLARVKLWETEGDHGTA